MIYRLLEQLEDADLPVIRSVYRHPSVSRFIGIDENHYWQYVTEADNVWFYKVLEKDYLVATVHLELSNRILYMSIVVLPEYRNRGFGTRILDDIKSRKLLHAFDEIRVSIDEDNAASLKLFEKMGFACTGRDEKLKEFLLTLSDKNQNEA